MISSTFVHMIESHSDQIADRVLRRLRDDARAPHMASLPEAELRDSCQRILRNLGHWLLASSEPEIARHYEERGRVRAEEGVPLHEVVLFLVLLKDKMLGDIRDQDLGQSAIDLFAEEELEYRIGAFFDSATYYLIRGYEGMRCQTAKAGG